ncbi:hypothetical protein PVAP13_6KG064575 [Panicum virgatum]|uniref:Uncharacterized protein n=1 Tax=Panicum virgatum TaxID=38727 RepID=A0A8T0R7K6_PANVG|nr:hypothetical protein PVAP13_6KG064575 [Panicum virgatum]
MGKEQRPLRPRHYSKRRQARRRGERREERGATSETAGPERTAMREKQGRKARIDGSSRRRASMNSASSDSVRTQGRRLSSSPSPGPAVRSLRRAESQLPPARLHE